MQSKINFKTILLFIFLIVVFGVTHLPKLGVDEVNPDAVNWHFRSEQYVDAIKSRDFSRTYQVYHPGATLMFITGAPIEFVKRLSNPRLVYNRYSYEVFNFVAKYSLNTVILTLIVLAVFNLSKVLNFRVAYLAGLLLTVEPFFLGNSRVFHMDVLLSLLIINGLTTFYIGLRRNSKIWFLISSIYLGLSFWTKNVSILSILFVLGISFILFCFKKLSFKKFSVILGITILGFFVAGYSVLPALWVNPSRVFQKIYSGSKGVVDEGHAEKFLGTITEDPGPFYYPLVLAFKLSPVVLIVFALSLFLIKKTLIKDVKLKSFEKSDLLFFYYLFLFFGGYFLAIELANKKIDRYLLPLYPIILIFVSFYLFKIYELMRSKGTRLFMILGTTLIFVLPLFLSFPYYFVYNNPLFGGLAGAEKVVGQKSFGTGIFEVRDFLFENYGFVRVAFVDRKPMSVIYPSSMVFDARLAGTRGYDVLILDNDSVVPDKVKNVFVYDKSLEIGGINFWNFYVKKAQ